MLRHRSTLPPSPGRRQALLLLLLALALCGCEGPPSRLVDTGYRAHVDRIYWLDAHRIIFHGMRPESADPDERRNAIRIHDTRTGETSVYRYAEKDVGLCSHNGWIDYRANPDEVRYDKSNRFLRWRGWFGEETLNDLDLPADASPRLDRFSCRWYADLHPLPALLEDTYRVGVGYGRVQMVPEGEGRNSLWFDDTGERGLLLDTAFATRSFLPAPFLGGYVHIDPVFPEARQTAWRETDCLRMRVLRLRDGTPEVAESCIPWPGFPVPVWSNLHPVRDGYLILNTPRRKSDRVRNHYFTAGQLIPLYRGHLLSPPAISTDGCRVALAPSMPQRPRILTLQYIDLCKLREELPDDDKPDQPGTRT